ncbi:hypothetical protein CLOM_g3383 [Closterium sp. NIES-68]|nr:hypothetical protein CLOM_g3383 [Closterium sp. NIES-68]GJP76534.1 hypothetical protein CLOP_g6965 [Closterium sp. NIES-67]
MGVPGVPAGKQHQASFQQQTATQRNEQTASQQHLLAQLRRRVNSTISRQQPTSAVGSPSTGIRGSSLAFPSIVAETPSLLSAAASAASFQQASAIPLAFTSHPLLSASPGIPAGGSAPLGIPASIVLNQILTNGSHVGSGVTVPGVSVSGAIPLTSNIGSGISHLSHSNIAGAGSISSLTPISPISPLSSNFASSGARLESDEDDEKKVRRILSNRQSAKRSRQRKRERLDELEDEVAALTRACEEANRKLKEAEASMEGMRDANQRMKDEVERLRREIGATGRQSQVPSQLPSAVSPACRTADFVEAVPACDETAHVQKRLRTIEHDAELKGSVAEVAVYKASGPSSPSSDVTRTDYTCTDPVHKEEAVVEDGLGIFGGGLAGMDDMGCLLGDVSPQGLELLDDALVRAMLDCMGEGELNQLQC